MVRTVCGQFCGIFGGFFAVVGPILHERCLSQVVLLCLVARNCTAEGYEPVCALLKCAFFSICHAFFVFSRGGSNMVAFRAKVDGTWLAKFQRRLRYRVTSAQPFLLSFLPPFSSTYLPFSHFFSFFPSFHYFSLVPSFFPFFHIFRAIFLHLLLLPAFSSVFFGQGDVSLCNTLANFVHHEAPPTHMTWHFLKVHFCLFLGFFRHVQQKGS